MAFDEHRDFITSNIFTFSACIFLRLRARKTKNKCRKWQENCQAKRFKFRCKWSDAVAVKSLRLHWRCEELRHFIHLIEAHKLRIVFRVDLTFCTSFLSTVFDWPKKFRTETNFRCVQMPSENAIYLFVRWTTANCASNWTVNFAASQGKRTDARICVVCVWLNTHSSVHACENDKDIFSTIQAIRTIQTIQMTQATGQNWMCIKLR